MMYWSLVKRDGLYYWRGESCWGGSAEEDGGFVSRDEALRRIPFGAGDWLDETGDGNDHSLPGGDA